jgi:hypothetical protein
MLGCWVVLERTALHQTRFRTPGVGPDARGVVLGTRGLVLFPSLDRLVAFVRAYSEEGSLDELLPSLEIRRLVTPLKTRELMLAFHAESSYRMDRVAGLARLTGGLTFTGTQRHFVKYRDAASPLGYDVQQLLDEPADLVLYDDSFQQSYRFEATIPFRDLVFKLAPRRMPPADRTTPSRLFVTAEPGVGEALMTYLFRWQIPARVALAEWPPESAFEDRSRRLHLFDMSDVPERMLGLLTSLPGVYVFEPFGETVGVELGHRHPIALESCASLFQGQGLFLFRGDGEVTHVSPLPPFAPVRSLVRAPLPQSPRTEAPPDEPAARAPADPQAAPPALSLRLRLAPSNEPWRNVVATLVPLEQRQWLARLLYALPPRTLGSLRMARGERVFYLLDSTGIEGIPLGTFYREVASRIYVPAGFSLVPAVAPSRLEELLQDRGDGHAFFEPGESAPRIVAASAFAPVSRRVLREVAGVHVHADRPLDTDPALPELQYDKPRRFPLWGVPGKESPQSEPDPEDA